MVILVRASFANSGLYMAFSFLFATALATNFGCCRFRIMPEIISTLCTLSSEVAGSRQSLEAS